ncbi:Smr/MutS family protein [candidate division KSB1 bacterium]
MEEYFSEEPVRVPITDELDLHTFRPRDVKEVVEDYIGECRRLGIFRVRIIHGKGRSVQKTIVRSLLAGHPDVTDFFDAPPGSGSWGATIACLKEK